MLSGGFSVVHTAVRVPRLLARRRARGGCAHSLRLRVKIRPFRPPVASKGKPIPPYPGLSLHRRDLGTKIYARYHPVILF